MFWVSLAIVYLVMATKSLAVWFVVLGTLFWPLVWIIGVLLVAIDSVRNFVQKRLDNISKN